jgi:TatD DNase family protein
LKMVLFDTHTHLFSEAFIEDRTEIIERAIASGVSTLLLPNIDADSIGPMHDLCQQYPKNCFPMMGLHPGSVKEDWEQQLEIIRKWLFSEKYIAVGEIGMDLYWDKTFRKEQEEVFRRQIQWAKELKLPIVIHARDAFDEIFHVVDELHDTALTGVFHCFTGSLEQAMKIKDYGTFKIGLGGVLTFKKSGLDEVVKDIPMELLVLETDSPYLAPSPHRGKRNESSYLTLIADKLSEVKQMRLEEIAEITSRNARELFNL